MPSSGCQLVLETVHDSTERTRISPQSTPRPAKRDERSSGVNDRERGDSLMNSALSAASAASKGFFAVESYTIWCLD